jgi:hypothetical protein
MGAAAMFFLLRVAFWLGLVLILLPSGGTEHGVPAKQVGAAQAISAASETVHDLRGFCAREPNACTVGSELADDMAGRARAGATMLYHFLTEALAPSNTAAPAGGEAVRGSVPVRRNSENTLTPADLQPAWRGPPLHRTSGNSV